jgi:hypothetical protein
VSQLVVVAGYDFRIGLRWTDDVTGAPIDITDYDITMTVTFDSEESPFVYEIGDGITLTDAADGQFEVFIPRTDTASFVGYGDYIISVLAPEPDPEGFLSPLGWGRIVGLVKN